MTRTSRRVIFQGGPEVTFTSEEVPDPGPGEVLVETRFVGLCGSDIHAVEGIHPFMDVPYAPGHEVVGTVAAVGHGVEALRLGDRVVVEPTVTCGECANCKIGATNTCEQLVVFGCQSPGGMADSFLMEAVKLHVLPDELPDTYAPLIEPLATPIHAVERAGISDSMKVGVLGGGTIGVLLAVVAAARGARVTVTDIDPAKRERAVRLGAEVSVTPEQFGQQIAQERDFDVVFDCVATATSSQQAVDAVRRGGTIVVVGVPAEALLFPLHLVQDRELSVLGSLMYTAADYDSAMAFLSSRPSGLDELITARFDLEDAGAALAAALSGREGKVIITIGSEQQEGA